ncbi:DUF1493 family protein [Pseudoduganella rivuli]|nr:DUF1493 family protein [Pseudoduganella rivuli]
MMLSHVTNQSVLPDILKVWLRKCGLSNRLLNQCQLQTRLYHDLGLYGDIAETYMDELAESHGVDLSDFVFERYFPSEFPGNTWVARFLVSHMPFGRWFYERDRMYAALTLEMVLNSMISKKFQES